LLLLFHDIIVAAYYMYITLILSSKIIKQNYDVIRNKNKEEATTCNMGIMCLSC